MSPGTSLLLFISSLIILPIAMAQDRAPHGIGYENPFALSPLAYDFFHPKLQNPAGKTLCTGCSPLPMAAKVEHSQAEESKLATSSQNEGHHLGAGGVAGIVFGLAFVAFLAMGAYYVVAKRGANTRQGDSVRPNV